VIFGATGFGLMFQNTVRNQRSQDFLIEQDMKSWFAAESGYQWLMARLGSATRWDQRYFAPNASDLKKIPLYSELSLGLADTQVFVQELSVGEIAYLIRGNWAQRVDGTGDRNRTVISGTLRMVGPDSGPQVLVTSERLDLSRQTLQKIATDPKYREYLMETGNPEQLRTIAEWLMVADVSDAFERPDAAQFLPQIMSLARVARRVEQDLAMARFFIRKRPELAGLSTASSSLMQNVALITANVSPRDLDLFMASQMAAEVERWPVSATIQLEPSANGFFDLFETETMTPQEFAALLRDTMDENPDMGVGILAQTVVKHKTSMVVDKKQVSVTEILLDGLARDAQRLDDLAKMGEKREVLASGGTEAESTGDFAPAQISEERQAKSSPLSVPSGGTQIRRVPEIRNPGPMVSWIALAFDEKNDLESGPPRVLRRVPGSREVPRPPRPRMAVVQALQSAPLASGSSDSVGVVNVMREIQRQQREEMERASQNQPGEESDPSYPSQTGGPSQQVATVPPTQVPQQPQPQRREGWYPGKYIGKFMKGVFGGGK